MKSSVLGFCKELYPWSKKIVELLGISFMVILITYSIGYQGGVLLEKPTLSLERLITPPLNYIYYAVFVVYMIGLFADSSINLKKAIQDK